MCAAMIQLQVMFAMPDAPLKPWERKGRPCGLRVRNRTVEDSLQPAPFIVKRASRQREQMHHHNKRVRRAEQGFKQCAHQFIQKVIPPNRFVKNRSGLIYSLLNLVTRGPC